MTYDTTYQQCSLLAAVYSCSQLHSLLSWTLGSRGERQVDISSLLQPVISDVEEGHVTCVRVVKTSFIRPPSPTLSSLLSPLLSHPLFV